MDFGIPGFKRWAFIDKHIARISPVHPKDNTARAFPPSAHIRSGSANIEPREQSRDRDESIRAPFMGSHREGQRERDTRLNVDDEELLILFIRSETSSVYQMPIQHRYIVEWEVNIVAGH